MSEYEVREIYHLAALLSTRAEFTPETAHEVNVEGTLGLLELAVEQSSWRGQPVKFLFPSSIAVYGFPTWPPRTGGEGEGARVDCPHHHVRLQQALLRAPGPLLRPATTASWPRRCDQPPGGLPGTPLSRLISAVTVPRGGTSDYAPEMIHAAARGEPYACFVREDTHHPLHGDARRHQGAA